MNKFSELERKVWDEIEKEVGVEILVSIIPVHKSKEKLQEYSMVIQGDVYI